MNSSSSSHCREQTAIRKKHQIISSCEVMDKGAGCSGVNAARRETEREDPWEGVWKYCFHYWLVLRTHMSGLLPRSDQHLALEKRCDFLFGKSLRLHLSALLYCHSRPGSLYCIPAACYGSVHPFYYYYVSNYPVLARILLQSPQPQNLNPL